MGHLAKDRRKNSIASLYDSSAIEKVTYLCISSWILVADGSGGFESCSIDQNPPEVSEAEKRREFDEFIDQLEEFGFSNLNNEAWIQLEFDAIKAKTLSELEEDLKKLLEDSKQETSTNGKIILPNCIRIAEPSLRKKKNQRLASRKLPVKRSSRKAISQTSMRSMKR